MSIAINPYEIKADVPTYLTTTLYDLIATFHSVVAPHEDALVVAIVTRWLRAGRITLPGAGASRRLRRHTTLARCRWGFHPPMTTGDEHLSPVETPSVGRFKVS
jgi:hypothetical protein